MTSNIVKAGAWCNGEVAYIAWQAAARIDGCLGFMITRVHESGDDAGERRVLPTWIAFTDQSNPNWQNQDSSVWPIQQFEWRDLTLRKSRDTAEVRPIDFSVHYEIVPVGVEAPGRTPVPETKTALYRDAAGQPRYVGTPRQLFFIGEACATPSMAVTHRYSGANAAIEVTFTNGILSTQNLLQQLRSVHPQKPGDRPDRPDGLLSELKKQINDDKSKIRAFLTGDVLSFLRRLLERAAREGGEVHLALYELQDRELIALLEDGVRNGRVNIILSTAGSADPNPAQTAKEDRKPKVWDTENNDARKALAAIDPTRVHDRMFNNDSHIGHDKFAVYVKDGAPKAVLTGSTNWTATGLCTQSNNAIIIEDAKLAERYLDFWNRLMEDKLPARVPIMVDHQPHAIEGAEPNKAVQGQALRGENAKPGEPVALADGKSTARIWFSPNTKATTKTAQSPLPPDLAEIYDLMAKAKTAILFLSFMPGESGNQNIIGQARDLAKKRPELLVMGAVSDPRALPEFHKPAKGEQPATVWWPDGDHSKVAFIRATAIRTPVGDMLPELLSAGHAIIHDKIIVIDPLDEADCIVITGSHNLGYKASYANDENLLIIKGNSPLAVCYAVHVLDIYDHYVTRAKLEDQSDKHAVPSVNHGFLRTNDGWQDKYFPVPPPGSLQYFLTAAPAAAAPRPRPASHPAARHRRAPPHAPDAA